MREADELRELELALREDLLHGLVTHLYLSLVVQRDTRQFVRKVVDASLDADQHLRHPLVLPPAALELLRGLREVGLEVVDDLAPADAAAARELELLHLEPQASLLFREVLDLRLVVFGEILEVIEGVLLRQELLDDLVHAADAGRLLDAMEGLLVVHEPL